MWINWTRPKSHSVIIFRILVLSSFLWTDRNWIFIGLFRNKHFLLCSMLVVLWRSHKYVQIEHLSFYYLICLHWQWCRNRILLQFMVLFYFYLSVSLPLKLNKYTNVLCCFGVQFFACSQTYIPFSSTFRYPSKKLHCNDINRFVSALDSFIFSMWKKEKFSIFIFNCFHKFDWLDCTNRTPIFQRFTLKTFYLWHVT